MNLLSVILPTYNDEKYIKQSIDSVFKQTFKDWELIIINDASTDSTKNEIEPYLKDKRIKYYENKKNLGLVENLNRGIDLAKGKYIARLDGDDVWIDRNKLKTQIDLLEKNNKLVLIGTWGYKTDENNKILSEINFPTENENIKKYFLIENPFIHSAVVFRKDKAIEIGKYNKRFPHAQDYELWLRIGSTGDVVNIPKNMVFYRLNTSGLSSTNYNQQIKETIKIVNENRNSYPSYELALLLWYMRRLIPKHIRESIARRVRGMKI